MGVLSNLEPRSVFRFFEEICAIPHGSGNVEAISDHLVRFARERDLEVYQDALKNVVIIKEATAGYEAQEPVILQGHMDMVAVKTPDCPLDLLKDGLQLRVQGDLISAVGTSLGGDDGIAVAYALAILDDQTISHPRLEVVITVDEEVGMDGARGIDLSMLKGRRLLNIDSEEEGIFTVGCAGGARMDLGLEGEVRQADGTLVTIEIGGLQGGHSGVEIHKERGNSNQLMGRLLEELTANFPVRLADVQGGLADNAIPRQTKALLILEEKEGGDRPAAGLCQTVKEGAVGQFESHLRIFAENVRAELATRDPGFRMEWQCKEGGSVPALSAEDTRRTALFLNSLPNGVQAMSPDVPGLVETSLNLGILRCETLQNSNSRKISAVFSVRSSVESAKEALIGKLASIGQLAGAVCDVRGEYPGWQYRVDSPLRDRMIGLYREMYGEEPEVVAIHAGLECGLLMGELPDLDCVSFGPNMQNIHTTEETLSISSTERVWRYLLRFLEEKP